MNKQTPPLRRNVILRFGLGYKSDNDINKELVKHNKKLYDEGYVLLSSNVTISNNSNLIINELYEKFK